MARVRLRPMTAEEFGPWRDWQIQDYANDLVRNGKVAPERAPAEATTSLDRLLTDGLETEGHKVWVGEDRRDR